MSGRISFIGAGPGAADLITLRGANRIAEADIIVWTASLVTPECVRDHAKPAAELVDSSRLTHEQAVEIYRRAERERLNVARVHSGDPALWGAVQDQYDACARMNVEVEIVPGVAAFSAAAATVGRELTVPEVAESLVLTRLEGGKTPMPERQHVREYARHGSTMVLYLSAARTGQLATELRAGGYADDTQVLVAHKVTWPDELLLRTTVGELESTVQEHKLWRHTLFLVGEGLRTGNARGYAYQAAAKSYAFRRGERGERGTRREARASRPLGGRGRSTEVRDDPTGSTEWRKRTPFGIAQSNTAEGRAVDPDVAWWAVREWQEDARSGTTRSGHGGSATRSGAARATRDAETQPQLFGAPAPDTPAEPAKEESDGSAARSPAHDAAEPVDTAFAVAGTGDAVDPDATSEPNAPADQPGTAAPADQPATSTGSTGKSATGTKQTASGGGKSAKSARTSGAGKQSRSGKSAKSTKSGGSSKGSQRRSASSAGTNSADRESSG